MSKTFHWSRSGILGHLKKPDPVFVLETLEEMKKYCGQYSPQNLKAEMGKFDGLPIITTKDIR